MCADFLGFGGLALTAIGTVAITKEVANATKNAYKMPRQKRVIKLKKPMKKRTKDFSIESLARF